MHGLSWDDTWSLELDSLSGVRGDWAMTVDWSSEWVNDTSEHALTDWNIDNGTSSLDDIALLDLSVTEIFG